MSIKEIAALAGVSVATVSRVVNQKGGYSTETEQRVKAVIRANQYQSDKRIDGMQENGSPVVVVLVPDVLNEHFSRLIFELQTTFLQKGYLAVVCNSNESEELEMQYLESMEHRGISGIIAVSGAERYLQLESIPTVYVDRRLQKYTGDVPAVFVESDNQRGGYLATKELIEQGCQRIAFVTDMLQESCKVDRYQGYCKALMEAGIKLDPTMILQVEIVGVEAASRLIKESIHRGLQFDGIMCTTDMLALGSILALQEAGLKVPADVKVTGYDDISSTQFFKIPITTVHQYTDRIAKAAVDALVALMQGKHLEEMRHVIPVDLIRRESTGH